jgi:hypothetical protein
VGKGFAFLIHTKSFKNSQRKWSKSRPFLSTFQGLAKTLKPFARLLEIADLLGCKKTRASQLRQLAAKAGFIKTRHRFIEIARLPKPDHNIRNYLNELYPKLQGKIRFSMIGFKGVVTIVVLVQSHDEIIPKLQFKSISKFNNLVVAPQIKKAVANRINEAAKIAA